MSEPLTLTCYCPGDDIFKCEVSDMLARIAIWGTGEFPTLRLGVGESGSTPEVFATHSADFHLVPVDTWLDNWESLTVNFKLESSLNLGGEDTALAGVVVESSSASLVVIVTFVCTNLSTGETKTTTKRYGPCTPPNAESDCFHTFPSGNHLKVRQANTSAFCVGASFTTRNFWSRSLDTDCPVWDAPEASLFIDNPKYADIFIPGDDRGGFCLCASGGTPPYVYWIKSGSLPCGQNLEDGCIVGLDDGTCQPTRKIVFAVTDADGNTAETECFFSPDCSKVSIVTNVME